MTIIKVFDKQRGTLRWVLITLFKQDGQLDGLSHSRLGLCIYITAPEAQVPFRLPVLPIHAFALSAFLGFGTIVRGRDVNDVWNYYSDKA